MLSQQTYIKYLESVVISLLEERPEQDEEIIIVDNRSIMYGFSVTPYSLKYEMNEQRLKRIE